MSKLSNRLVALAAVLLMSMAAQAAEIYVAPGGNDANPGSKEQPLATLPEAQQAARMARSKGQPATVVLRGGTYYLTDPLIFSPADSGTKESPVVYRAYDNETPVISGGVKLDLT